MTSSNREVTFALMQPKPAQLLAIASVSSSMLLVHAVCCIAPSRCRKCHCRTTRKRSRYTVIFQTLSFLKRQTIHIKKRFRIRQKQQQYITCLTEDGFGFFDSTT